LSPDAALTKAASMGLNVGQSAPVAEILARTRAGGEHKGLQYQNISGKYFGTCIEHHMRYGR